MNAPFEVAKAGGGLDVEHVTVTYRNGHTALNVSGAATVPAIAMLAISTRAVVSSFMESSFEAGGVGSERR